MNPFLNTLIENRVKYTREISEKTNRCLEVFSQFKEALEEYLDVYEFEVIPPDHCKSVEISARAKLRRQGILFIYARFEGYHIKFLMKVRGGNGREWTSTPLVDLDEKELTDFFLGFVKSDMFQMSIDIAEKEMKSSAKAAAFYSDRNPLVKNSPVNFMLSQRDLARIDVCGRSPFAVELEDSDVPAEILSGAYETVRVEKFVIKDVGFCLNEGKVVFSGRRDEDVSY